VRHDLLRPCGPQKAYGFPGTPPTAIRSCGQASSPRAGVTIAAAGHCKMTTSVDPVTDRPGGRQCGECVACCKILEIDQPELKKPTNVLCPNCTGTGCGIYATRPTLCRTWECFWRRIPAIPEHLRPDKIGVVFWIDKQEPAHTPFDKMFIIGQAIDNPAAFSHPLVKSAIEMFARNTGLPIWLGFGGERRLIYPDEALQDAILNPATTHWQSLVPAALAWRKNYGMD
jgi:hypothetical protein